MSEDLEITPKRKDDGAKAGIWCRGQNKWTNENSFYGFRIAGYAK